MRKIKRTIYFCSIIVVAATLSGCFSLVNSSPNARKILSKLKPNNVDHVCSINLGRGSMFCVRALASFAEEDEEAVEVLKYINKIDLNIYEVKSVENNEVALSFKEISAQYAKEGWELFMRVRDGKDNVLMFYKQSGNNISSLSIVALSDDELVIAEIKGNMQQLIASALRDKNGMAGVVHVHDS